MRNQSYVLYVLVFLVLITVDTEGRWVTWGFRNSKLRKSHCDLPVNLAASGAEPLG